MRGAVLVFCILTLSHDALAFSAFHSAEIPDLAFDTPANWGPPIIRPHTFDNSSIPWMIDIFLSPQQNYTPAQDEAPCTLDTNGQIAYHEPQPAQESIEMRIVLAGYDETDEDVRSQLRALSPYQGPKDSWPFSDISIAPFNLLGKQAWRTDLFYGDVGSPKQAVVTYSQRPTIIACAKGPSEHSVAIAAFPSVVSSLKVPTTSYMSPRPPPSVFVQACFVFYMGTLLFVLVTVVAARSLPARFRGRCLFALGRGLFLVVYGQVLFIYLSAIVLVPKALSTACESLASTVYFTRGAERLLEFSGFLQGASYVALFGACILLIFPSLGKSKQNKESRTVITVSDKTNVAEALRELDENNLTLKARRIIEVNFPILSIRRRFLGGLELKLGRPFIENLSSPDLAVLLAHENYHASGGSIDFYNVVFSVSQLMNSQSRRLRGAAERWMNVATTMGVSNPGYSATKGYSAMVLMAGNRLIASILENITRLIVNPFKWRVEFECDRAAARSLGVERLSHALVRACVVAECRLKGISDTKLVSGARGSEVAETQWLKACDKVAAAIRERTAPEDHPPLSDRLAILGVSPAAQLDLLGTVRAEGLWSTAAVGATAGFRQADSDKVV